MTCRLDLCACDELAQGFIVAAVDVTAMHDCQIGFCGRVTAHKANIRHRCYSERVARHRQQVRLSCAPALGHKSITEHPFRLLQLCLLLFGQAFGLQVAKLAHVFHVRIARATDAGVCICQGV